ncbi:MAG: tetratricopeptide repeat protein [Candidatus Omnitrophica bacterium]|nr:tetratricopeptide repeat protein [Candidatus Omnitrophota bacterium]
MKTVQWLMVVGMVAGGVGTAASAQQEVGARGAPSQQKPAAPEGAAKAVPPATTGEYDFGDFSSETLATKAWQALDAKDYAAVEAYTKKCISLYEKKAVEQQASLTDFAPKEKAFNYWALNDVATCYFILGKASAAQGKAKDAQAAFQTVIDKLGYAQCWDPKGWFWKVAEGAKDQLAISGTSYDFGDYTSQTLTTKAWEALDAGDYKGVELYTKKCIELYEPKAVEQQASLTDFAPKEKAFDSWALNDVATCYFILGKAHAAQGKLEEAKSAFNTVVEKFSFAQCWDPQGWFWKVAKGAGDQLNTLGTSYDFGDYTSQTLTTKAWEALDAKDHKGVELYTRKCIELYEEEAKKQQASLTAFAPKEKAFDNWALNDVATCYFILGESLMVQKRFGEAKEAFERVVSDFGYAQCWDPKGWFWKVAVGARGRLNKILAESGG